MIQIPAKSVLQAFGLAGVVPERLEGGQGSTYRAGGAILKPVYGLEEANWTAHVFSTILQEGFQVPRPIATHQGHWVCGGWAAWEYLEGQTATGQYQERLLATKVFHQALGVYPRPAFLDQRHDVWAQADRIVWNHAPWQPHPRVGEVYQRLEEYVRPLDLAEQIIHGDIAGNMLYRAGQPLAIIDFSPYWRPAAYAEALLLVDCILWEGAAWFADSSQNFVQLVLRAAMRRLVEIDLHYQMNALPERNLGQVQKYAEFISQFGDYFS